jgi:hypothetical protein
LGNASVAGAPPPSSAAAASKIERGSAIGVLCLQIRTVLREEFHECIEAVRGGSVQRRLMRYGIGAGHWLVRRIPPPPSDSSASGSSAAATRTATASTTTTRLGNTSGINIGTGSQQQFHGGNNALIRTVAAASHARSIFDTRCSHQRRDAFLARQIHQRLVPQQQVHQGCIAAPRRAKQGSRSLSENSITAAVLGNIAVRRTTLELNIWIRPGIEQQLGNIERGHGILARNHGDCHRCLSSAAY